MSPIYCASLSSAVRGCPRDSAAAFSNVLVGLDPVPAEFLHSTQKHFSTNAYMSMVIDELQKANQDMKPFLSKGSMNLGTKSCF